jgi:putative endonuclease
MTKLRGVLEPETVKITLVQITPPVSSYRILLRNSGMTNQRVAFRNSLLRGIIEPTQRFVIPEPRSGVRDPCLFVAGYERSCLSGRMTGYVYITASQKNGTLYTGVTADLGYRIPQHKERKGNGFTARYGATRLVWYEEHSDIRDAIEREKQIKRWRRAWKIELIEEKNPDWNELFKGWGW